MNPIFALLSYRAFRPDPRDTEETVAERFRLRKFMGVKLVGNRLLVLSVGRTHWRAALATLDADGAPTLSGLTLSPAATNRDALADWLRDYAKTHRLEYTAVGIGHGFSVTALNAVVRLSEAETMQALRTEPARLFGEGSGGEEINGLAHHPEVEDSSLRFKLRNAEFTFIRDLCADAGLTIVRTVCEQSQLIDMAYAAGLHKVAGGRALLVALPSSYVLLHLDAGGWHSPRFDPALDESALTQIEAVIREATPPGGDGRLVYIDAGMAGLDGLLKGLPEIPNEPILGKPAEIALLSTLFR